MNISNMTFNNISSNYCKYSPYWKHDYSDQENYHISIAMTFLCVLGILSNIFIIVLAAKYTERKNLHHLIINMAVSDALYLASGLWQEITYQYEIEQLYPNGVWGDIICKISSVVRETAFMVSVLTLLVISIARFRATRRTLQKPQPYTCRQRAAVLGICWLIPLMIIVAGRWSGYDFKLDEKKKQCLGTWSSQSIDNGKMIPYAILIFTIFLIVIILTLNVITVKRLSAESRPTRARLSKEQLVMRKRQARPAVSMVVSSTVLYACCWFPSHLLHFYYLLNHHFRFDDCVDWNSLHHITAHLLTAFNSCLSPLIYIIFLPDFKEAAKRVLCCCKTTTNQQDAREEIQLHHIQR